MACILPKPYPDELLFSVIARYCSYLRLNLSAFARDFFGKKSIRLRADLPGALQEIAEKTYLIWGHSTDDILNELTLFPYYQPFLPEKTASKKITGLTRGGTGSAGLVGVNSFRVKSPPYLRFCTACRSMDLEKYGETYWRRMHQLPGTLVCLEHELPLAKSSARVQPTRAGIGDATVATEGILESDVSLDENELKLALLVARHCQKILLKNNSLWPNFNLAKTYREAALERGFSKIPGVFSPPKFKSAFKDFFSRNFLEQIGISTEQDEWITTIFFMDRRQQVHPLEHILIQVFLEQMAVVASSQPFGPGPWKCPNPYGVHDDAYPVKKILTRTNRAKEVIACVRCSCGFFFSFNKTAGKDKHLPMVKHISSYGPTWKRTAESLLKQGLSVLEISAKMSLNVQSVNRLLNFEPKRTPPSLEIIEAKRNRWLQVLEKSTITGARKKYYGLYQYLRKYDHDWMMSQSTPRQKKIDLAKRDHDWSLRLEKAALQIPSIYPGRRIAKTLMVKTAGLNLRLMAELDKFPKCKSVIERLAESRKYSRSTNKNYERW